ncbi:hypothetical protein, partial [Klebsiella pneumoniae]|uniref:hypothetical protein n=1 Tax=Klebsiella pneumoniae TaxID=573 RepID=UPI003EE0001D
MVIWSPFSPKGKVLSAINHSWKFSLAFTKPVWRASKITPRSLLIPVFNKEYRNGVIEFDDYVSSIFDFIAEKKKELIFLMRQL